MIKKHTFTKPFRLSNILIGLVFTFLFISLAVIFVINFRPLYYLDINLLNIPKNSGLSQQIILENYNALINYCSPFFRGSLSFPSLNASASGLQHFAEVKNIFNLFYIIASISLVISIFIIFYKKRKQDYSYLKISSLTASILPLIIGALIALNFDKVFYTFHKLFFKNDYWIFDPVTDPVINILPDTFFMHCAILIVALVLGASLGAFIIYKKLTKGKFSNKAGLS